MLDLSTREVVGYALSTRLNAELAIVASNNATKRQQPVLNKLIFHSDIQNKLGLRVQEYMALACVNFDKKSRSTYLNKPSR